MSTTVNIALKPPPGYASREVALFIAQLDDLTRRLTEATRDLKPEELDWQPRPGMNTIGMLLAHIAIAEAWWARIIIEGQDQTADLKPILGVGADDDGMPLPEEGLPPPNLACKEIAYFDDLLLRARNYLKEISKRESDQGLEREIERPRPDGSKRIINVRWFYYHLLEHFAGHSGQILMLRHLYRTERVPAKA